MNMRFFTAVLLLSSVLFVQDSCSQQVVLYPINDSITSSNSFLVCGTLQQKPLILKTVAGTPCCL